jgi:GNAT superfamily N-acetyltransferase
MAANSDYPRLIRGLVTDELNSARTILAEAAQPPRPDGKPLWLADEISLEYCQEWQRAGEFFGGFEGRALAAVFCLCESDTDLWPEATSGEALYLHKLAVRLGSRGTGWTGVVIDWALGQGKERGCLKLRLDTVAGSRLVDLYQSYGFIELDKAPVERGTNMLTFMERALSRCPR